MTFVQENISKNVFAILTQNSLMDLIQKYLFLFVNKLRKMAAQKAKPKSPSRIMRGPSVCCIDRIVNVNASSQGHWMQRFIQIQATRQCRSVARMPTSQKWWPLESTERKNLESVTSVPVRFVVAAQSADLMPLHPTTPRHPVTLRLAGRTRTGFVDGVALHLRWRRLSKLMFFNRGRAKICLW